MDSDTIIVEVVTPQPGLQVEPNYEARQRETVMLVIRVAIMLIKGLAKIHRIRVQMK